MRLKGMDWGNCLVVVIQDWIRWIEMELLNGCKIRLMELFNGCKTRLNKMELLNGCKIRLMELLNGCNTRLNKMDWDGIIEWQYNKTDGIV